MNSSVTLCAAGDIFISRSMPKGGYDGFKEICDLITRHDVRFANLETTVHDNEGTPGAVSGGTWSMCPPAVLDELKDYGFNLYNAANNHAMDYGQDGLLATIRHLRERNIVFAGIGENLSEANAPVYIETSNARVALIAVTATFPDFWAAGNQKHDIKGRPGVNPLHVSTRWHITASDMKNLQQIAIATGINARRNIQVKEGFAEDTPGVFVFGGQQFVEDSYCFGEERINKRDIERILSVIKDAKCNADYVLVSIHVHQPGAGKKDVPPQFMKDFSHACIESGATAILGHGPHILRGVEIYQGSPIFYSLGNFLFENDTVSKMPCDLFDKYGLSYDTTVTQAMNMRSKNGTRGLAADPMVWSSVLAGMDLEDGSVKKIKLYPIDLHHDLPTYRRGLPSPTSDISILEEIRRLSEPFGTRIEIRNSYAEVML